MTKVFGESDCKLIGYELLRASKPELKIEINNEDDWMIKVIDAAYSTFRETQLCINSVPCSFVGFIDAEPDW